jgi:hypothetical protein
MPETLQAATVAPAKVHPTPILRQRIIEMISKDYSAKLLPGVIRPIPAGITIY